MIFYFVYTYRRNIQTMTLSLFYTLHHDKQQLRLNWVMQEQTSNLPQRLLRRINAHFQRKEQEREFTVDSENHKIDKKNGIVKNFMRLTNKTLIGMTRVKLNKGAIFSGILGLITGYACYETDDAIILLLKNYRPTIRDLLIKEVLKNQEIKDKLNSALLENVYTNSQIQYKLSQVLVDEAIRPQMKDLFDLSKRGIIQLLGCEEVKKAGVKAAAVALQQNTEVIAKLALQFLGGQFLAKVIRQKVSTLLLTEEVGDQLSFQLKKALRNDLNTEKTRESLYSVIRQKFINW